MLVRRLLGDLSPGQDFDQRRQAKVLTWFGGLLAIQCLIWSVGHAATASIGLASVFAGCGVATGLLLYGMRRGLSLAVAGHAVLAVAFGTVVLATWYTGGLRLTNVCPFLSLIIAAIFVRRRSGLPWAFAALGIALAFQLAAWSGVVFPDVVAPEDRELDAFLTWLFAALLVFLYAWLYDALREEATRQAERATRVRDHFLANLSHEIRNPLHVILAFQKELAAIVESERASELTAVIGKNAEQLNHLLTDLLELARGQASDFLLDVRELDPVAVFNDVQRPLAERCRSKGLRLSTRVGDGTPRSLWGDAARVNQVLTNLTENAVKYTDAGEVRFEIHPEPDGGNGALFVIEDTGVGVPVAEQARIFDAFAQVETSLSRSHGGVGLGLPIAQRLISTMKGRLALTSASGTGSRFEVFIPSALPPETSEGNAAAVEPVAIAPTATVLLVEDNDLNREVARLMLERLGLGVTFAADGNEAVNAWKEQQPDVVLMDVQMPGMDGLAATRRIRQLEGESGRDPTTILATTGYSTTSSARDCAEAGMDDVLVKPFSQEALEQLLRRHLVKAE